MSELTLTGDDWSGILLALGITAASALAGVAITALDLRTVYE